MDAIHLDSSTLIIIALAIMVIVVVWVLFRRNTGNVQVKVKGPGGIGADVSASNQSSPTPAAVVENSESSEGGILAKDESGRGAAIKGSKAKGDVVATVTPPSDTPPKT